jgi:hypothetical protein
MFALTISYVLGTGVSKFLEAAFRCRSEGHVEQRTDDHDQKRGIVGVYPNTHYATDCLTIFSVARREYSGRALAAGFVCPLADDLDLHVG